MSRDWRNFQRSPRYSGDPQPVDAPEPVAVTLPEPPPPLTLTDEQGVSLRKKLALIAIKGSIENAAKEAERERHAALSSTAIGRFLGGHHG